MKVISPFLIPVKKDLGSDFLLLIKIYGKLPIIGSRGGPGGKFGGLSVPLYVTYAIKSTKSTINMESMLILLIQTIVDSKVLSCNLLFAYFDNT